jgi:hypothetical protein
VRGKQIVWLSVVAAVVLLFASEANHSWAKPPAAPVGIFEDHADVGAVLHPGSVEYDARRKPIPSPAADMVLCRRLSFVWRDFG